MHLYTVQHRSRYSEAAALSIGQSACSSRDSACLPALHRTATPVLTGLEEEVRTMQSRMLELADVVHAEREVSGHSSLTGLLGCLVSLQHLTAGCIPPLQFVWSV